MRIRTISLALSLAASFFGLGASAQEPIAQGGPLAAPSDRASATIDQIHPQIVARAQAMGLPGAAGPPLTAAARGRDLNFPLRLKPPGRGASPFAISNFVDLDPTSPGILDWNCGNRTYDGHKGNDLFLTPFPWWKMDQAEVDVVAAAPGTIVAAVDGNFDRQCVAVSDPSNPPANYVTVLQSDGFYAYYLHLKNGSVTTEPIGAAVAVGERLGNVGSSGHSSGPHLHFELRDSNNTTVVDAFSGSCQTAATMWKHQWNAQDDPRLIQVASLSAPPVFPACGTDETTNYSDSFTPGATVYSVAFMRDQGTADVAQIQLIQPNGTIESQCSTGTPPSGIYQSSYWYCSHVLPASAATGTWRVRAVLNNQVMEHAFFVNASPSQTNIVSAVLPSGRSVQTSKAATVFATIINSGATTAEGCWIQPETPLAADFSFQTTDPNTNQLTGSKNSSVSIPAGMKQTFLVALQPQSAATASAVTLTFRFKCTNADAAPFFEGVNSMLLSFDPNPVPDMIAVGLTPSNDGYSHTGGPSGTGLFVIAATNIGASTQLTARVRPYSNTSMPLNALVCQTDPNTGQCLSPPAPTYTATVNTNQNTTWTAFLQAGGTIPQDPAGNRVAFEFLDSGGVVRGSTTTAVTSQ